ncbi:redoxin domain-containing protein [Sinomicrobium sp.]
MKKYYLILAGLLACACKETATKKEAVSPSYVIEVDVRDADSGMAYLESERTDVSVMDSTPITNGKFTFRGTVDEPTGYFLKVSGAQYPIKFLLSNDSISISGAKDSLYNAKITGATENDKLMNYFSTVYATLGKQADSLYKNFTDNGTLKMTPELQKELDKKWEVFNDHAFDMNAEYVKDNASEIVAAIVIDEMYVKRSHPEQAETLYNLLTDSIKNSYYGKRVATALETFEKTSVGKVAPDFCEPTAEGEEVCLSSFKGKYVLIDFWASWCGPCRKENPNLVKAYAQYRDKGFEILGVSIDEKRDLWLKAVEKDNMTWTQLSSVNGWKSAGAQAYNVNAVPTNYLIDPEGVIIAKNLRGEALQEKLQEVFSGQ